MSIEWFRLVEALDATVQPTLGQSQRLLGVLVVALSWRTLVEGHHDVGADHTLGVHHVLRGEDVLRTVDMGTKLATFLTQLTDTCQREHLKTTRVGEDRAVPRVKLMQTACFSQNVKSWPQIQMVGVT